MTATEAPTPTATTPPPNANPDRDVRGRFAPGNGGGPGNPFARKVASLRRAMLNAVSDQDMAEVTAAVLAKAKGGDLAAAKLLYQYTAGRPCPAPDPDGLEAHEMQTYFQRIVPMAQATELMQGFPLDVLLAILPHVLQARAETVSQQVAGGIPQAQERCKSEAPPPNPPGPPSLKGRGEEDKGGASSPPFPLGKGGGGVRSEPPSTNGFAAVDAGQWVPGAPLPNGDIGSLTDEEFRAYWHRLFGADAPPPETFWA